MTSNNQKCCIYDNLPMLDSWYNVKKEEEIITTTTLKKARIHPTTKVSFSNESPVVHHYEYVNKPMKRSRSTFVKSLFRRHTD